MLKKKELDKLRLAIQNMTPRHKIYELLRDELSKIGRWKNLKRGNPSRGYLAMRERLNSDAANLRETIDKDKEV